MNRDGVNFPWLSPLLDVPNGITEYLVAQERQCFKVTKPPLDCMEMIFMI